MKVRIFLVLFEVIILILMLLLELHNLQLIFYDNVSLEDLAVILLYHVVASIITVFVFFDFSSVGSSRQADWRNYLFFFVIIFYLPVIGISGLILSIPFLLKQSTPSLKKSTTFKTVPLRDLSENTTIPEANHLINLSNLYDLLNSNDQYRRLQAIYATLRLKDKDAIAILHKALADPVDDIRLLAYTLLDRKENDYSKRISRNKQALKRISNQNSKRIYQQIINDYWELIHLNLVQGEAQVHILIMASQYAEAGLKIFPDDLRQNFLYAKILLKQKKYSQAYIQLKKTEKLGMPYQKLLIYYVEIAFYGRQYREMKHLLQDMELLTPYPKLSSTAQFWRRRIHEAQESC